MIILHKTYLPSFGLGLPDQTPVCVYTLLSVNERARDCAAYRAIGAAAADDALVERMKAGGTKISAGEARVLFDEIDDMKLRYRP